MTKLTVDDNGTKRWRNEQGQLHKEDGPAVEWSADYKAWFINGLGHREDGPAIEWSDGTKTWYLNGIRYTEEEYKFIQFMKGIKVNVNE